jgi:hypothetical protein
MTTNTERFSMAEFKPLTMSERKLSIENDIANLSLDRTPLIIRKQEIELELAAYRNRIRGNHLPQDEYNEICQWQRVLGQEKLDIEKKFLEINDKKLKLEKERERLHQKIKQLPNSSLNDSLVELRDKYSAFASDTTRVSSMRAMASKFVEEIQSLLNQKIV